MTRTDGGNAGSARAQGTDGAGPDRDVDQTAAKRSPWRSWLRTVRARVTLMASLAITAGVVLGLLLMYLLQTNAVRRTIDDQLRTYAAQIAQAGQSGTWPDTLPPSTLDPAAEAQVTDAQGHVLAATATLSGQPAVYRLPPGSDTPVRLPAADGRVPSEVRTYGIRATVGGRPVTIVAGTGTGLLNQVNEQAAHELLLGVPIILLLAGGAVWLIAGRALRPVEEIRHAVTEITSADLTRRVPEPGTDDEVGKLAITMNDMLARLEESAQRQRRFVADASHELRSPLAAIRTTLEVGLAHPDTAPWPTIAKRAAQQTQRLEDLTQQLLVLAKADDRQLAAAAKPVDVARMLDEIRATTSTGGVRIALDAVPDIGIVGDQNHVERLFRNIVDNAVRYADSVVEITTMTGSATIRVAIDDDGPGIPPADRERVFNRFVRLDDSRDRHTGNSGLGLAIAREIVTAHRGRIAISQSPLGGARVTVELPREPPGHEAGPATSALDALNQKRRGLRG
jgi:signal transduction histidine kinase